MCLNFVLVRHLPPPPTPRDVVLRTALLPTYPTALPLESIILPGCLNIDQVKFPAAAVLEAGTSSKGAARGKNRGCSHREKEESIIVFVLTIFVWRQHTRRKISPKKKGVT